MNGFPGVFHGCVLRVTKRLLSMKSLYLSIKKRNQIVRSLCVEVGGSKRKHDVFMRLCGCRFCSYGISIYNIYIYILFDGRIILKYTKGTEEEKNEENSTQTCNLYEFFFVIFILCVSRFFFYLALLK